jgi:hypothetical protein
LTGLVARGSGYLCNELFGLSSAGLPRYNCDLKVVGRGEHARLYLVAKRDIRAGEELGCYYGVDFCRAAYLTGCRCTTCLHTHTCNGAPTPNHCDACNSQIAAMLSTPPHTAPYGTLKKVQ